MTPPSWASTTAGAVRRSPTVLAILAVALLLTACGVPEGEGSGSGAGAPSTTPPTTPADGGNGGAPTGVIAPMCADVPSLAIDVPADAEPTGTTARPIDDSLTAPIEAPETGTGARPHDDVPPPDAAPDDGGDLHRAIQRWGDHEGADVFAGYWYDNELDTFVVAVTGDVAAHSITLRERIHPGLAIAEATSTEIELREMLDRVGQVNTIRPSATPDRDLPGDGPYAAVLPEPGMLLGWGLDIFRNRIMVSIYDPDESRLIEVSDAIGVDLICFEIIEPPADDDAVPSPFVPAPGADLGPASTSIDVLVNERACASGATAEGRIATPRIEYRDDAVVVTLGVIPVPGMATCPGNPDTPFTVELTEPLGGRTLLDGSRTPPAEPTRDW